jgi:class 3 adenylate cyclase
MSPRWIARVPAPFAEEFAEETRAKTANAAWVVTWIAFCLYPVTIVLDWLMHPQHLVPLAITRFSSFGAYGVLILGQVVLRRLGLASRWARPTAWVLIGFTCANLDIFNAIVGGVTTHYYAGFTLLLTAVLVAFPWSLREMGIVVGTIALQYDVVMIATGNHLPWTMFLNANYFFVATCFIGLFWTAAGHNLRIREFNSRKDLEAEKRRSDDLLLNVLPEEVAAELKRHGKVDAKHIDSCTILFTDFVGFTAVTSRARPDAVVASLDAAFSRFDAIVEKWGLEKLKTIGDAYMAAGGVLGNQPDHLLRCVLAGIEMQKALEAEGFVAADGSRWRMRIGVHPGSVVAGVIGQKKFAFDLWGDTVNTASRLESAGEPGTVNVTTATYGLVASLFEGVDRGVVPVRGREPLPMTAIRRLRPELSDDDAGTVPNARFATAAARFA